MSSPAKTEPLNVAGFSLPLGTSLVEASAGTGKTFTIQYIVLDLLLRGVPLREILLVTFTKAATQELRQRLQAFLAEVADAVDGSPTKNPLQSVLDRARVRMPEEQLRALVSAALLHIDEAPIFTIHGFCQRLLHENAFAAATLLEGEPRGDVSDVSLALVRDFLRRLNLELPVLPGALPTEQQLLGRARQLEGFRNVGFKAEDPCEIALRLKACAEELKAAAGDTSALLAEVRSFQGRLKATIYSKNFFGALEEGLASVIRNPVECSESLLEKWSLSKLTCSFKNRCEDPPPTNPFFSACEALFKERQTFRDRLMEAFDVWVVQNLPRLLVERELVSFDDLIVETDRSLRSNPDLVDQVRRKYRAALVDEFQDTDARQYRIFDRLFGGDSTAKGAERWFVMIGDPKQSIYGFRKADIDAYLTARSDAGHCYTLPTNYRSELGMVEAVNCFFDGVSLGRKNAPGGAIAFQPAACGGAPGKATLRLSEAELPRLWHREISALSGAPAEAADASVANVSHDILALLRASRDGHLGLGMGEGTPSRALEPGDIAVLVNFNREADAIQESLRGLGVTSVRLKSASVFASDEARQYLLALRAMLDPSEALVNPLLIGPLFEYSERQLRELPTGRRQEIVDTLRRLGQRWREGFGGNNVAWQGLLEAFEVRALLLSRPEGERRLTNFLQLAEIAGSLERTEALGPDGLIRRLGILIEEGGCDADEANQMRLESDARAVKILTMHSAKGLEFPVVFLPTLWCREARASSELRPLPEKHDPDTLAGWEADDEKFERDRAETLRLGYVALTRSINLCVYYHAQDLEMPKKNNAKFGKGWFDAWMAAERSTPLEVSDFHDNLNRLAARPRLLLAAPCEPPSPQPRTLPLPSDKGLTITSFSALSRHSSADGVHLQEPASRGGEEEHEVRRGPENPGRADLLLPSFPGGTRSGTCLHACFEEVDFNVPLRWPEAAASAIARHFPERPEPWRRVMATEILEVLEQLTAKPFSVPTGKPVVLADLSSNKLAREMDFYFPVHGAEAARLWEVVGAWCKRQGLAFSEPNLSPSEVEGFLTGSIDLFFAQGEQYYVLDWKTNRPLEGQPETRASYDTDGMHEQMLHGQYYLQALIYSVAATAFLRERLGETFSFERHFGGFVYVFVRGLGPKTGRFTGLFNQAEIDAARAILGTGLLPERSVS